MMEVLLKDRIKLKVFKIFLLWQVYRTLFRNKGDSVNLEIYIHQKVWKQFGIVYREKNDFKRRF